MTAFNPCAFAESSPIASITAFNISGFEELASKRGNNK